MLDRWEQLTTDEVIERVEREGGDASAKLRRQLALTSSSVLMTDLAVRDWAGERYGFFRHATQFVTEKLTRVGCPPADGLGLDVGSGIQRQSPAVRQRMLGELVRAVIHELKHCQSAVGPASWSPRTGTAVRSRALAFNESEDKLHSLRHAPAQVALAFMLPRLSDSGHHYPRRRTRSLREGKKWEWRGQ